MSAAFAIIGKQGSGKSTSIKDLISKTKGSLYIYDVQDEYKHVKNNFSGHDFEEFLQVVEGVRNSVIVFEEATIHITKGTKSKAVRNILVGKRHTNNMIIFVFHSVRSMSAEIRTLIDFTILHKTNDNNEYVRKVFEYSTEIYKTFLEVNKHPNKYFKKLVKNSND